MKTLRKKNSLGVILARTLSANLSQGARVTLPFFVLLICSNAFASISESQIPQIINTIIQAESSGNPKAIGDGGESRGLMQIKKATWQKYTRLPFERAFDASANRKVGEAYVRAIIERYGDRASLPLVIYTYNTGHFVGINKKVPVWTLHHPNLIYREIFNAQL